MLGNFNRKKGGQKDKLDREREPRFGVSRERITGAK